MVNTSRMMPPTPVAAPWIGFDEGGVVVALHLEDRGKPVADINNAGVSPGPQITAGPSVGSRLSQARDDL